MWNLIGLIALLPAIQYDAEITKNVTSYHTNSNGNGTEQKP